MGIAGALGARVSTQSLASRAASAVRPAAMRTTLLKFDLVADRFDASLGAQLVRLTAGRT